jgi:hypothetical protein
LTGDIVLPATLTTISTNLFRDCHKITSVTIPSSITSIEEEAFRECYDLQTLTIEGNPLIAIRAFQNTGGLKDIYCLSTTPPTLSGTVGDETATDDFSFRVPDGRDQTNLTVHVPCGTVETYQATSWIYFNNIIDDVDKPEIAMDDQVVNYNGNVILKVKGTIVNNPMDIYFWTENTINGVSAGNNGSSEDPVHTTVTPDEYADAVIDENGYHLIAFPALIGINAPEVGNYHEFVFHLISAVDDKACPFISTQTATVKVVNPFNPWIAAGWDGTSTDFTIVSSNTVTIPEGWTGDEPDSIIIADGGQLINNSTNSYTVTVERELVYAKWEYVGSPIGTTYFSWMSNNQEFLSNTNNDNPLGNISAFQNSKKNYIVSYSYDYNQNMWRGATNWIDDDNTIWNYRTDNMNVGLGYFVWNGGADNGTGEADNTTLYFHGQILSHGEGTVISIPTGEPVSPNDYLTAGKWVSLSNPFVENIKVSDFLTENSGKIQGGISGIWFWNKANNSYDQATNTDKIPVTGGFMVNVSVSATGTLQIHRPTSAKNEIQAEEMLMLNVTSNNLTNHANILFNEDASNDFDIHDAYVLIGDNEDMTYPYFLIENRHIVTNAIKSIPYTCPFNLFAYNSSVVELSVANINDLNVSIIDLQNGIETPMTTSNVYTTSIDKGENANRFILKIYAVNLENLTGETYLNLWAYNNRLTIDGKDLQNVEVYNTLGQTVYSEKISGNQYSTTLDLSSGSYIAKATSKTGTKTIKFVINK